MCSGLCPCDVADVPESEGNNVKQKWEEVFTNQALLTKYERCLDPREANCDVDKALFIYDNKNDFVREIMEKYNIQAYKTFQDCYNDLRSGKRNTEQVTEE